MTQTVPINADTVLPPTTAQGWARGLEGTANISTALAPIDGMSHTEAPGLSHLLNKPVNKIPRAAPITARRRSFAEIVRGAGKKRCIQANNKISHRRLIGINRRLCIGTPRLRLFRPKPTAVVSVAGGYKRQL